MSTIIVYKHEYHLRIGGGLHKYARVEIFPNEDHEPGISVQKADALVREYNPRLRLKMKFKRLTILGSVATWVREFEEPES